MRKFAALCLTTSTLLTASPARADKACGTIPQVLIVLDRSGTMKELVANGDTKWKAARDAVSALLKEHGGHVAFGMMLFSRWDNGPVSNCKTGMVNVAPAPDSAAAIGQLLNDSYPSGDTPATNSLIAARSYLATIRRAGVPQYVILITDGKETCSPNWPDTATDDLLSDGVKTYVVGFAIGADQRPDKLDLAALNGGTNSYYKADDPAALAASLKSIGSAIACCGNGVLDPGEKCDTGISSGAGACPTLCDDGRANTKDELSNGGSCNAECTFVVIPPPPVDCGNGKVDSGETCDTAIAPGKTGACPTVGDCNDADPCTTDSVVGSACTAACSHVNTCPVDLCGNGVLDPGEKCDPAIAKGALGYCPRSPADCFDDNPCTADSVFSSGCNAVCQNVGSCPQNPCGNGKIDNGETCDSGIAKGSPGACPSHPSDCDDGNDKTADYIVGDACTARCEHKVTMIEPVCGNGAVEAGEWCDTGIPGGQPGACPVACDDDNGCTRDTLVGSGCLAYCSHETITAPANNDGCCPAGATGATDSDCPAACGNGALEPGEKCDPGIASGKAGACPTSCPTSTDPCAQSTLGGSPCAPQCISTQLGPKLGQKDGCCPAGMTSGQDADCLPPCTPDRTSNCTNPCAGVSCPDRQFCKLGKCEPWPDGEGSTTGGTSGQGLAQGCDCSVKGSENAANALPLLALFGLALLRRRRRSAKRR